MPWQEKSLMDQRLQFIADCQHEVFTVVKLADRYEISRKTAYKWIDRYADGGAAALGDRSRRPKGCPHQTAGEIVDAVLGLRRRHPTWGPKKLRHVLTKREPAVTWPARSTIADLLRRHDLIPVARRRPPPAHPGRPDTAMAAPNDTWTADFKCHFKTRNALYCYPLTVVDGCSRYLLGCQGLRSTEIVLAKPVFLHLVQEFGLPNRMRTDNGVPLRRRRSAASPRCPGGGFGSASCPS